MQIRDIIQQLELWAPAVLQESYDNSGLLTGSAVDECKGILICLDATEKVVEEAIQRNCNLVIAHHPIIFSGLKKITGRNYVERTIIKAIKNDIAIYAIHTNLDNIISGVNAAMAAKLGLVNVSVLSPKPSLLKKLYTFVPEVHAEAVRSALFLAGGGHIGQYYECSFNSAGTGSFKAGDGTDPFVGKQGERHYEAEIKVEVIFPVWLEQSLIRALKQAHPFEEVAFDIISLSNDFQNVGAGLTGSLPEPVSEKEFLDLLKKEFQLEVIRHTPLLQKPIRKVALCGGAGSFLTKTAVAAGADVFITGDVKYHEFFDAEGKLVLADIGHWESEQFTIDLLSDFLTQKFPTFAVLKSTVKTNPVEYYR